MILVDGENCLLNILIIFYFGDKIFYENVRGLYLVVKKIELWDICVIFIFFDLFLSLFYLNYFEKIYLFSDM